MRSIALKTIILAAFICGSATVHPEDLICRGKDKSGTTTYAPCGENPDPSTVVHTRITITMPPQAVTKPAAEKNPYVPDLKIDVKPSPKEAVPPPAGTSAPDEDTEEASGLPPEETEADTETSGDSTIVIPRTAGRPGGKNPPQPKPAATNEE